ncbi:MAG: DNA starvation/stationary phase protection protein [Candidatus Promineifilaceae bacterium]
MIGKTTKYTNAESHNGRHLETADEITTRLNTLLADEHLLYVKTRDYHWNVQGLHFVALHGLFERQYESLALREDIIAEQVRKLEGKANGTMHAFLGGTQLSEEPGHDLAEQAMIGNLLADHEAMMARLEGDIEFANENADEGTVDMLVQTLREHQEMAWMLRSLTHSSN